MARQRLKPRQKQRKAFFAGLLLLSIAFWMIFISQDNFGFVPGIIGAFLLLWKF